MSSPTFSDALSYVVDAQAEILSAVADWKSYTDAAAKAYSQAYEDQGRVLGRVNKRPEEMRKENSFGGHLTAEPGAGKAELMLNDVNRFASGEGHFGGSQTSEVVHLDDLREGGVLARQGFEGLVHLEDFHLMSAVAPLNFDVGVPRDLAASTALAGGHGTGVVHQDLPHDTRHEGQEMSTSGDRGRFLFIEEPNIGFVDQRGWLEGVSGRLVAKEGASDPMEFAIDERQELVGGRMVTVGQPLQEQGNPQGIRFSIIRHCSMILHRDTETGTGACGPEHYRPFP
jgi:hypothetical protein